MRTIIQIAVAVTADAQTGSIHKKIVAVDSDGGAWELIDKPASGNRRWAQLPDLPPDGVKNYSAGN